MCSSCQTVDPRRVRADGKVLTCQSWNTPLGRPLEVPFRGQSAGVGPKKLAEMSNAIRRAYGHGPTCHGIVAVHFQIIDYQIIHIRSYTDWYLDTFYDFTKSKRKPQIYNFAFQAARSADSSGRSRPSHHSGHSWNHFSLLQMECTDLLWPRSTYLPIVKPCAFSYDRIVEPVALGSPTTFCVRGSSKKQ